ncbi:MAG: hypothetical protein QXP41_00405 [Candidatus Nitrosocaldus sp.]
MKFSINVGITEIFLSVVGLILFVISGIMENFELSYMAGLVMLSAICIPAFKYIVTKAASKIVDGE